MAEKKAVKKVKEVEQVEQIEQIEQAPAKVASFAPKVLNRYRVEKVGDNDAYVYERIKLNANYAGKKGVKEFVGPNGSITYYTEKLVKKYSDNVVKA